MISSIERTTRRKAVWGPKRTLAAVAVLVLGLASNALAAARTTKVRPLSALVVRMPRRENHHKARFRN